MKDNWKQNKVFAFGFLIEVRSKDGTPVSDERMEAIRHDAKTYESLHQMLCQYAAGNVSLRVTGFYR